MPRDSISASTSLRFSGLDVARFLLSTYAIPSSLDLIPEMQKAPAATNVAAEASSPQKLGAVYTAAGRNP
jgi:hypothetical protein